MLIIFAQISTFSNPTLIQDILVYVRPTKSANLNKCPALFVGFRIYCLYPLLTYENADKTEYLCFYQKGDISTLNGSFLKFTYPGSSSRTSVAASHLLKITSICNYRRHGLHSIGYWSYDWSFDKIKSNFFQAVVVSVLLYGCTTWTHTKCIEKNLDGNCTRKLQAIFNKSRK